MIRTATLLIALAFYSAAPQARAGNNFHEIDKGKMYRSAQLTGAEFEQVIKNRGIKTIINLRGEFPNADWYVKEAAAARKHGVQLVNIHMSAENIPHRENLIMLLDTLKTAPRPLLIHCKAGADRTGEASALYQMLYMGKTRKEALNMLTTKYDHVRIFKPGKSYFIREVWQGETWAYEDYEPCDGRYKYYSVGNPFCV
ncbi:MAG: dual specificity protein phosphatase family protein [Bdellovibrionota bacterium]